jgi:hypothetical protein
MDQVQQGNLELMLKKLRKTELQWSHPKQIWKHLKKQQQKASAPIPEVICPCQDLHRIGRLP